MCSIFGLQLAQNPKFVYGWLKTFVLTYRKIFEERGKFYMGMKGLTLDNWMEAIMDGRKGDVLALYGLSLLTDTHTYVHLHDGQMWTTLKNVPYTHNEILKSSGVHIMYLGRGMSSN